MMISEISAEDIRLAKPIALQRATGIPAPCFNHWSADRDMTVRTLNRISVALGTTPEVVLKGFELRKQDYQAAKLTSQKFEALAVA